mgnify:CR=1 FL=1
MTTDQTQTAGDGASQGGGNTPPPAPPSISELLNDESKLDTPVPLAQVKDWFTAERGRIITEVEQRLRSEAAEREAAQRARADQQAAAQEDIEFASSVYANLSSPDPEVRAAAEAKMQADPERYNRGRSLQFQRDSSEAHSKAVNAYMAPVWQGVREAGYESLFAEVFKPEGSELLRQANGNWMLAAMKHAEQIGYQRGATEAADEADRQRRAAEGADGPPAMGAPGGSSDNSDLWAGIDRTKPGAGAEYRRRLAERQSAARR